MFEDNYFKSSDLHLISEGDVHPYQLKYYSDGILYIRVHADEEETPAHIPKLVAKIGELVNHKKVPILVRHDLFALPGRENRDLWAKKDTCPYSLAEVFIVQTYAFSILAKFYLKFTKSERPTKMFSDLQTAKVWLLEQAKLENSK